ncbi:uncharacterized protein MELLADRAFT_92091 [Melampsora larici-populina 98AG31]|uniref:Uncharacterized protein n=1 Tax=Melampsora larici-populina (strain 98AG31 / pathotype 3-4-7) TaxID=747676 RepID=F4SEM5_MELLP|nr:uncharacterized protein MELLADRAFT_92091 [Melampsora larici-populina 98AG31]EGF96901.1 hypothetical protein MELLADRAFT_92091 [Melampsora larici-populina 98AG31]
MGRAMKNFYNPVQRATRSQLDALSSSSEDHKPHQRLPGPYLASTPWRRHSRRRTTDGINEDDTHHATVGFASVGQNLEPEVTTTTTTESSSTNLDIPKKYNEQPFDLDQEGGDVFEEYFLTPSQAAQQRLDRLTSSQPTSTEATQSTTEIGDQVSQQRAVLELAYARHRLQTASQALSGEELPTGYVSMRSPFPSAAMMVSSGSRSRNTSTQEETSSASTSSHTLAAPRLTHREPPTTQETTETRLPNLPAHFREITEENEDDIIIPSSSSQYRLIPVEDMTFSGVDRMPREPERRYSYPSMALDDNSFAMFSTVDGGEDVPDNILIDALVDWNHRFDF